jgi:hypothetical protein
MIPLLMMNSEKVALDTVRRLLFPKTSAKADRESGHHAPRLFPNVRRHDHQDEGGRHKGSRQEEAGAEIERGDYVAAEGRADYRTNELDPLEDPHGAPAAFRVEEVQDECCSNGEKQWGAQAHQRAPDYELGGALHESADEGPRDGEQEARDH